MVHIVLATHGEFADGLANAASMILGDLKGLTTVGFLPSQGPEDLASGLAKAHAAAGANGETLFLVDLHGGSPFNQSNKIHAEHPQTTAVVAGVNLPMLIDALEKKEKATSAHQLAKRLVKFARKGIQVRPKSLMPVSNDSAKVTASEKPTEKSRLPEGTVVGDGKISYVLTRVDSRLLHGQVAVGWSKAVNPTRIIVVSDSVAKDHMRKTLIGQAAPEGIRANVIPISKLAEIDKDPRFGATRALLLFETPQEVLQAMDAGVDIKEVNLGSMSHSPGKVMISNSLAVDKADLEALAELKRRGVALDVRKVPADRPEDLEKLINNAKIK